MQNFVHSKKLKSAPYRAKKKLKNKFNSKKCNDDYDFCDFVSSHPNVHIFSCDFSSDDLKNEWNIQLVFWTELYKRKSNEMRKKNQSSNILNKKIN